MGGGLGRQQGEAVLDVPLTASGQLLSLQGVGKTYRSGSEDVEALSGITLDVSPGQMLAVTGSSGSGKSTLLACAGGMDSPTSGTVRIEGRPLAGMSSPDFARLRRRVVGYVFQSLNLLPSLTAVENVALPLDLDRRPAGEAAEEASRALERVGLHGFEERFPGQLSGGQQQRVAIARAVVGGRRLILADEPTGALDTKTGDSVIELLRELTADGAACVLVTHNERHAAKAGRVVNLQDGRMTEPWR